MASQKFPVQTAFKFDRYRKNDLLEGLAQLTTIC
jgi:hypothetical protein